MDVELFVVVDVQLMRCFATDRVERIFQFAKRRSNLFDQWTKRFSIDQFIFHVDLDRLPVQNTQTKTNHSTDVSLLIKDAKPLRERTHKRTNERTNDKEQRFSFLFLLLRRKSVGDAVCAIASASSFPEPFLHDGKHLRLMHRNLAANRFSDHLALLNAFQQYEREKFVQRHSTPLARRVPLSPL